MMESKSEEQIEESIQVFYLLNNLKHMESQSTSKKQKNVD